MFTWKGSQSYIWQNIIHLWTPEFEIIYTFATLATAITVMITPIVFYALQFTNVYDSYDYPSPVHVWQVYGIFVFWSSWQTLFEIVQICAKYIIRCQILPTSLPTTCEADFRLCEWWVGMGTSYQTVVKWSVTCFCYCTFMPCSRYFTLVCISVI